MSRPSQGSAESEAPSSVWPLVALAIGSFAIGTSEFMPMGLLSVIARSLHISIPTAGILISAYAIGVLAGTPAMTLALSKLTPRKALMSLMAIFVVGNALSANAAGFGTLLASRVVTSLSHGAFFGLGAVFAASVAPKGRPASGVAAMFSGLTIANIGGVPAASWLGEHVGWRPAFFATSGMGVAAFIFLWLALPLGEAAQDFSLMKELRALIHPSVLFVLTTTVMTAGAMFTLYTYVAPILLRLTRAPESFLPLALAIIGIGFTVGNFAGGRLADWSLKSTLRIFMTGLGVIMLLLPLVLETRTGALIGLVLWGAATFAVMPSLQVLVMRAASQAPSLASSVNIGAFNIGNAIGAAVGGGVIGLGLGYGMVPVAGGLLALVGVFIAVLGRVGIEKKAAAISDPPR